MKIASQIFRNDFSEKTVGIVELKENNFFMSGYNPNYVYRIVKTNNMDEVTYTTVYCKGGDVDMYLSDLSDLSVLVHPEIK